MPREPEEVDMPKAYARLAADVAALLELIPEGLVDCTDADEGDVGRADYARKMLVRAAIALDLLTPASALELFGVRL